MLRFQPPLITACRIICRPARLGGMLWLCCLLTAGCGTTQQNLATQQLLESDAVDAAIARIDFTPLTGRKVFFDSTYVQDYKGIGFVNSSYIISGIRQQILAAGCLLQEKREDADYIIEGRVGTLGSDRHDIVYGIRQNNGLAAVAGAVPGAPTALPTIPELSVARKDNNQAAAKIALFAYDRESRERVWQSGLSVARSTARDTWVMGAGPFQSGTIHRDRVRFAGGRMLGRFWRKPDDTRQDGAFTAYERPMYYQRQRPGERLGAEILAPELLAAHSAASPSLVEEKDDPDLSSLVPPEPQRIAASEDAKPLPPPDRELQPESEAPVIQQVSGEVEVDQPAPADPPIAPQPLSPGDSGPLPFPDE